MAAPGTTLHVLEVAAALRTAAATHAATVAAVAAEAGAGLAPAPATEAERSG